jgi:hypothetical protein
LPLSSAQPTEGIIGGLPDAPAVSLTFGNDMKTSILPRDNDFILYRNGVQAGDQLLSSFWSSVRTLQLDFDCYVAGGGSYTLTYAPAVSQLRNAKNIKTEPFVDMVISTP